MRRATGDYDAFLSYAWDPADAQGSDVSDAAVARRLRYAMQDLGKPRTRRSDLEIFLDRSVQTPSPDLWRGILDNLDRSRFLIVLCSPRAAASDGVAREVQHWLDTGRSVDDLLVVLLDGSPEEALPAPLRRLRDAGTYDPLFVDLRWVASARDLDSRTSSRFREDVATLLAPIRGVAKQTLVDEELTVRERSIRVQRRFIVGLSTAVVLALVLGLAATLQWRRADGQARIAESRALAAGAANQLATGLDVAQLLAVEGFRRDDNLETRATLLRAALASPGLVRYLDAGAPITVLTASTDGNTVVAGTEAGRIRRWALSDDGQARDLPGLTGQVTAAATDADGDTVAATDGNAVRVWRGDEPGAPVPLAPPDKPTALGLSPSGRWLVVALRDPAAFGKGVLAVVDRTGAVPGRRLPVDLPVSTVVLPDEDEVVALNGTGLWQRLRLSTGATLGASLAGLAGAHDFADAVAPDGGSSPGRTATRRSPCGGRTTPPTRIEPDLAAEAPGRSPEALAVAPGGGLVAVADSGAITVSRTRAPTAAAGGTTTLTGNAAVSELRFLDRDRRLVSASGSAVALWDLYQLARSGRWRSVFLPSTCNACGAPSVAVSPGGGVRRVRPGRRRAAVHRRDADQRRPASSGAGAGPDDGRAITSRWTGPTTLEVVVPHATRAELVDSTTGNVVTATAVSATGPGTLNGAVTVVVRPRPRQTTPTPPRGPGPPRCSTTPGNACRTGRATPRGRGRPRPRVGRRPRRRRRVADRPRRRRGHHLPGRRRLRRRADRRPPARLPGERHVRGPRPRHAGGRRVDHGRAARRWRHRDHTRREPGGPAAPRRHRRGRSTSRAPGVLGVLGTPGQTLYGMLPGLAFTARRRVARRRLPRPVADQSGIRRAGRLRPRARPARAGGVRDGGSGPDGRGVAPVRQRRGAR